MVETDKTKLPSPDIRTDEEKRMDDLFRRYSDIPEPIPEEENPNALFKYGWGRRKSYSVLVASSGIGKSVISTQLFVPWALGKPGLIGSPPLHPLRVSFIQTEDDDTEMGEFRRDHRLGYVMEGWDPEEIKRGESLVWDWSQYFEGKTDADFIKSLELSLRRYPMDVVVINPFQDIVTMDINDNTELKKFVVHGLLKTAKDFGAFFLLVHHTNKPNLKDVKQGGWGADETAAYVGAGGAVLTNSARSVSFIRRCTTKECAIPNSFKVIGAKRGARLGWKDAEGKKTNERIIAYSEDYIHWRVPTPEEIESAKTGGGGGAESPSAAAPRVSVSPDEAAAMIAAVVRADWPRKGAYAYCRDKLCAQLVRSEFKEGWNIFERHYADYSLRKVDDGRGAYHFENDPDAAQASLDLPDSQPNYGDLP